MSCKKKYHDFYNNIDRKNNYYRSNGLQDTPLYKKVLHNIKKFNCIDKKVLEIGSADAKFQHIVKDYTGVDIGSKLKDFYEKPFYVIDESGDYPFADGSFDFIFTNAVFEHIPDLNKALKEMLRVLKSGGIIMFNPAWQCRPWAAEGYIVRPYSDFNIYKKIYKASVPIRDSVLFRLLHVMPKRFIALLLFAINMKWFKRKIFFKKLKANYEKYWHSDSDACNSIDPYFAILYFKANGCQILNYPNAFSQFFVRTGYLIVKKG